METSMTISVHPSIIVSSPIPKTQFADWFSISHPIRTKLFKGGGASSISVSRTLVKCSGNSNSNSSSSSEQGEKGNLKDALSAMVGERVEELLNREENKVLLDGLEKATLRVEMAKRELAEIQRQELETKQLRDQIKLLETRASEIAECQREILEAKAMVEEAGRSLNDNSLPPMDIDSKPIINKEEERLESVKAASISALVGTLAALPIAFTRVATYSQLILPLSITFLTCALFGVTFRYAVRRDLDNFQLKSGTSAAFAFAKGLGTLGGGAAMDLDANSLILHASDGATYIFENLLIFAFAAVGLDLCIRLRLLSPFPIELRDSNTYS